jgi:hypothetical protein
MILNNDSIENLAEQITAIQQEILQQLTSDVDRLIEMQTTNVMTIEHTLDALLDIAFEPKALVLYKELCRYVSEFSPQTASFYVNA